MSTFIRLVDYDSSFQKEKEFQKTENRYLNNSSKDFLKISGFPISYWISKKIFSCFTNNKKFESQAEINVGIRTGKDEIFIRHWHETSLFKFENNYYSYKNLIGGDKKWFPITRGGEFRKWYGNLFAVINFENEAEEIKKKCDDYRLRKAELYFKKGISWTMICTKNFSARFTPTGTLFGNGGPTAYVEDDINYYLSFLNSKVCHYFLNILNPTMNFTLNDVSKLPLMLTTIRDENCKLSDLGKINTDISKNEWDSRETSWDFKQNELIKHKIDSRKIKDSYEKYCDYWKQKFYQLHKNEEELNKIFIEIYGLEDEITPEVPLEDITILKDETSIENNELVFKKEVIIKQFLSYAIGCILGRYSPDKEGLIIANQGETISDFNEQIPNLSFLPDEDNIIPVLDDEYFEDDIITRFKEFLKTTFGSNTLYENLEFIAEALGKRTSENSEDTIRRYFLNDFYSNHCKMYKKRPIYWLFTSGPEKAFNAFIYMHRYNRETLAKMRIDYLIRFEEKLEARKATLKTDSSDPKIKQKALNMQTKINKKLVEIRRYDEKLKHLADQYIEIDLDDGVNKNYKLFEEITAKI